MKKILLLATLFISILNSAQTKTKYEQKSEQLMVQLFTNLGISEYEINLIKEEKDQNKKTNMFFTRMRTIPNSAANKALLEKYKFDMQKSESLKTKEDFDKENEMQQKIQQQIDSEKSSAEVQKKDLKESITNINVFNYLVETQMNNWLQKGEFEKIENVNSRIGNEYKTKFEEICLNNTLETMGQTFYSISNIGIYNSDNEFFPIDLTLTTSSGSSYKDVTLRKKISGKVFVPIDEAERFKQSFKSTRQLYISKSQINDFKNFKWKLSESFFIPTEFEFYEKIGHSSESVRKFFKFQFFDSDATPISVNANDYDLSVKQNVIYNLDNSLNKYADFRRGLLNGVTEETSKPTTNSQEETKNIIKEKTIEEGKKLLRKFGL